MKIKIRLYTILKKYGNGRIDQDNALCFPDYLTLNELTAYLKLPEKPGKTFLVNGTPRSKEYVLKDGDDVKIFAFIGGG